MCPKKWRTEIKDLTLKELSKLMDGVSPTYLSRVERLIEPPSGKLIQFYFELSGGAVSPTDFAKGK